jgi:Raf kinase inhibitor-like YbhB/YbcL family protein
MKCFHLVLSLIVLAVVAMLLGACGTASPTLTATTTPVPPALPAATATLESGPPQTPIPSPTPTSSVIAAPDVSFTLTSTAFAEGETIPDQYTYRMSGQCDGANVSPQLAWTGAPANTQSFAIIVNDPDGGDWVHWVQFNIPGDATSLSEVEAGPDIGIKGQNDFGKLGYGGPCPPGGTHHYIFTLYALDTTLLASQGATRFDVAKAMAGHILAQAQLTGLRSR